MKQVWITQYFKGFNPEFDDVKPGSLHMTVPAPKGKENLSGVWIMGKTEPMRLLPEEYVEAEDPECNR